MTTSGFESFLSKLNNTDSIKSGVDKAVTDSLTRMYNRASKRPYTPIDTGELKNSRTKTRVSNGSGEFGYNKVYARRVEYGGRDKKVATLCHVGTCKATLIWKRHNFRMI